MDISKILEALGKTISVSSTPPFVKQGGSENDPEIQFIAKSLGMDPYSVLTIKDYRPDSFEEMKNRVLSLRNK